MTWHSVIVIIYLFILFAVVARILNDTHSANKAMAYIMLCLFLPILGIIFYLVFGINYWKKKKYSEKAIKNFRMLEFLRKNISQYEKVVMKIDTMTVQENSELASLLIRDLGSPLTGQNKITLLTNGEEKFPNILDTIKSSTHHIHLEYYIYECDETGMKLIEALIEKALEGIKVRFIYDDFGSPGIKSSVEKKMTEAGIEIFAFHKIKYYLLANRFNYRNHRKIIIVDGDIGFVGGINVSDKYVNGENTSKLYWRDTHIKIEGPATYYLQYLFIIDWNFCCGNSFEPDRSYFRESSETKGNSYVQIAAGGPDSPLPSILYSLLQVIYLAKEEILITTPYFIPGDSMLDALCVSALSGLKVKLLVPGISDSKIVNAASRSNYNRLLQAGVEIYLYRKGFIHAKTIITDNRLSVIGTANMDVRSFELNFEVNAIVYDKETAGQMRAIFFKDLENAEKINKEEWLHRPWKYQFPEKLARLLSPVL